MYSVVNLIPVAVYGAAALVLLVGGRRMGGLLCVLAASYCGVVIITFTRGTMGSVLLSQVFLMLLLPVVFLRPVMPPVRSRIVSRLTYALFAVYLLAIGVGLLRYDPALTTSLFGRFRGVAGIPLNVLMMSYRVFVLATLFLAFSLPLHYFIDRSGMSRCLTVCWFFSVMLSIAGVLDYIGLADMKFDITRSLLHAEADELHRVVMGFRRGALGPMMVTGIFLSYALTQITTSTLLRALAWASAPLLIVALLFSWSRAATVAMAVSAISLIFTLGGVRAIRGAVLSVFGLTIVVGVLTRYQDVAERMAYFRTGQIDASITSRQETWSELLTYLEHSPDVLLTGVGFQNFNYVLNVGEREVRLVAAHNSYLQVLTETGIFGFVIFVSWVGSIFWWLLIWRRQQRDSITRIMSGVFLSLMIGLLVSALTQETLAPSSTMVPWLLHFYLVLGIWVSWYRSEMWTQQQLSQTRIVRQTQRGTLEESLLV